MTPSLDMAGNEGRSLVGTYEGFLAILLARMLPAQGSEFLALNGKLGDKS